MKCGKTFFFTDRRQTYTASLFASGNSAIHNGPVALRPDLSDGLLFSENIDLAKKQYNINREKCQELFREVYLHSEILKTLLETWFMMIFADKIQYYYL